MTRILICPNPNDPSKPNVYAIKVDNVQALTNRLNSDLAAPQFAAPNLNAQILLIHKQLSREYQSHKNDLEKYFLQRFAQYGIQLFKADNDLSNWNKLSLNNSSQVLSIPCDQI